MKALLWLACASWALACTRPVELMTAKVGEPTTSNAVALPPAPAPSATAQPSAPLAGEWRGVGLQSDGQRWPIVVRLQSDHDLCATIDYPTVPCRGTWTCSGTGDDGWSEAREHIESGDCIDGGVFRYRVRGDKMEWTWSQPGSPSLRPITKLTARGTLDRSTTDDSNDDDNPWDQP